MASGEWAGSEMVDCFLRLIDKPRAHIAGDLGCEKVQLHKPERHSTS